MAGDADDNGGGDDDGGGGRVNYAAIANDVVVFRPDKIILLPGPLFAAHSTIFIQTKH